MLKASWCGKLSANDSVLQGSGFSLSERGQSTELIKLLFQNIKYAIVLLIVFLVINFLTPMTTSVSNLLDRLAPPATADVVSSQAIISSLRGIGRLVTVTSDPHKREVHIGVKQGFAGLTSYGANHLAEGIIEAGIDFTRIKSNGLKCEDTCLLKVPHPTITNCTITRLRQTETSFAIGGRDWELLEELGRYEAIKLFIDDVKELDILETAKEETEIVLGEFVSGITGKLVDVDFEPEPDTLVTGETCKPESPFGWSKVDGEWSRNDN